MKCLLTCRRYHGLQMAVISTDGGKKPTWMSSKVKQRLDRHMLRILPVAEVMILAKCSSPLGLITTFDEPFARVCHG